MESAYKITEAEKSHDPPSASWRPRRARAENEKSPWCKTQSSGRRPVSCVKQTPRDRILPSSAFCFYPDPQGIRCCPPTLGKGFCFTRVPQFSGWWSHEKHPHRHTQKQCLIWATCSPVKWHFRLTITCPPLVILAAMHISSNCTSSP